jgi:uncharacterized protein (TIGR02996 family)
MSEQAFLQAIIANPEDDAHRLIFADWLDERGDPRAPFIRIQCQQASLPQGDPREEALRIEEWRLSKPACDAFARSVSEALDPYFRHCGRGIYRRGLPDAVYLRPDDTLDHFIQHARELFQLAPIQKILFYPETENTADIHRSNTDVPTPVDKVRAFLQVPSLERVRDLEMWSPFEDIDAAGRLLAECPYLHNLPRLFLKRDYDIGDYFRRGTQTLLPRTQKLLRKRFGTRVSW